MSAEVAVCTVCGGPMPEGEEMFKFHGYSEGRRLAGDRAAQFRMRMGEDLGEASRYHAAVVSSGVFAGERWRNAPDRPWQGWVMWSRRWAIGDDVAAYLGVRWPHPLGDRVG